MCSCWLQKNKILNKIHLMQFQLVLYLFFNLVGTTLLILTINLTITHINTYWRWILQFFCYTLLNIVSFILSAKSFYKKKYNRFLVLPLLLLYKNIKWFTLPCFQPITLFKEKVWKYWRFCWSKFLYQCLKRFTILFS